MPAQGAGERAPVILGFPGNAWNAAAAAAYLHDLFPGAHVVVFHFRGYPPSTGSPSAAALLADAPLAYDAAAAQAEDRPIVAVGFSVGSAVAARLATQRPLAGLILVTPFDSLRKLAAGRYPWLPVALLLRHRMEPAEDLRSVQVPVAIVAAEQDRLVPRARTDALRRAVRRLVFDATVAGSDHNGIYGNAAFKEAMRLALARIAAG